MTLAKSNEEAALQRALSGQREHIFEALQGLDEGDLRRPVLPSHWTCLGLVNHLSLDVERFWFQAVVAGEQRAIEDVLGSSANAWDVGVRESTETVLESYKRNIGLADAIITARPSTSHPPGGQISSAPGASIASERSSSRCYRDRHPRRPARCGA
jgi:Protein of unknown function (DUF664)